MNTDKLYYISQDLEGISHLHQVRSAVDAGAQWIQLRSKLLSRTELLEISTAAANLVKGSSSRLIINDFTDIAAACGAHGVHLGRHDGPVKEARQLLGDAALIGGTANAFEDIIALQKAGVDYIGLGPYRFTTTKKRLSPVLGQAGIQQIAEAIRQEEISIPVFVIGGIKLEDVAAIMRTGVYGVAVASAINQSGNMKKAIKAFQREILSIQAVESK